MIPASITRPRPAYSVGAELDSMRLKRRIREKSVAIAWMREYLREEQAPRVAPRYLQRAIADFEAQLDTMNARLRHLASHPADIEDEVARTDARHIESVGRSPDEGIPEARSRCRLVVAEPRR
jgi:hypothetical protein